MVYKGFNVWEDGKSDYHSSGYSGHKSEDASKYNKEGKYASIEEDKSGRDIYKKIDEEDKGKKEKSIVDNIKQEAKYKKKEEVSEEEIKKKAAEEISKEIMEESDKKKSKKQLRTIEDAIKKAIEDEKKVCFLG